MDLSEVSEWPKGLSTISLGNAELKPFSPEEAAEFVQKMLGSRLITKQTGSEGRPCSKVNITAYWPIVDQLVRCCYAKQFSIQKNFIWPFCLIDKPK